jgi:hypothetical protein
MKSAEWVALFTVICDRTTFSLLTILNHWYGIIIHLYFHKKSVFQFIKINGLNPAKVGDFGLARWQPDGDTGVETRVIGTFGYVVHHKFTINLLIHFIV